MSRCTTKQDLVEAKAEAQIRFDNIRRSIQAQQVKAENAAGYALFLSKKLTMVLGKSWPRHKKIYIASVSDIGSLDQKTLYIYVMRKQCKWVFWALFNNFRGRFRGDRDLSGP
jgi:hypothetical protein